MSEEPDRFKEILEEIFDSKIEIIQMIDTIDKKLEKLILARDFYKSEPTASADNYAGTVVTFTTPVKKESKTKTKVISNALITGKIGILTEKAVQIIVGDQFAWIPKKAVKNLNRIVLNQGGDAKLEIVDWFIEKVEWKSNE